jgi:hypothetical protein
MIVSYILFCSYHAINGSTLAVFSVALHGITTLLHIYIFIYADG